MFESVYFEYPKVFTFLVIFIACDAYCKLRSRAIYFPHVLSLTQEGASMTKLLLFLRWLGVVMLILALMSPIKDEVSILAPSKPRAMVYVVDTSMHSFDAVRSSLSELIKSYGDFDQGLVAFDKSAYVVSALTKDVEALGSLLGQIKAEETSIAQEEAFFQMSRLFEATALKNKVALLFTDDLNRSRVLKKQFVSEGIHLYLFDDKEGLAPFIEKFKANEQVEKIPYTFKSYYYIYPLFFSFILFLLYVYLRNRRSV